MCHEVTRIDAYGQGAWVFRCHPYPPQSLYPCGIQRHRGTVLLCAASPIPVTGKPSDYGMKGCDRMSDYATKTGRPNKVAKQVLAALPDDASRLKFCEANGITVHDYGNGSAPDPRVAAMIAAGIDEATAIAAIATMGDDVPTAKVERLGTFNPDAVAIDVRETVENVQDGSVNPGAVKHRLKGMLKGRGAYVCEYRVRETGEKPGAKFPAGIVHAMVTASDEDRETIANLCESIMAAQPAADRWTRTIS